MIKHVMRCLPVVGIISAIACGSGEVLIGSNDPGLHITPAVAEVLTGETVTLRAVLRDSQGQVISGTVPSWSSSSPSVASVSNEGVVTGIGVGTTRITASSNGMSSHATVTVLPTPPKGSVVQVVPQVHYQQMTGWEGVAQLGELECNRQAFRNYRNPLLDRLVNELGINRVRLEIHSGIENPVDWYTRALTGDMQGLRSHRYEIINDNNDPSSANPAGFQMTGLNYVVDSVVQPLRARLAARGEKLYVNLNYVDFGVSAFEHSANPDEYAELILVVFRHLQSRYGWVPDAVEVMLEPDNTTNWRPATIAAAMRATGDRLKAAGFTPEFIAPSTVSMSEAVRFFDEMIGLPGVREYLKEISYHRYRGVSAEALAGIRSRAAQYGIRAAMLEHIGSGIDDLFQDLILGRNSAWQQYSLAFCGTDDEGSSYYKVNESNPSSPVINIGSRSRYLRHVFAFVRLGATRIGASTGDARFEPVAFRNPNGKFVLVVRAHDGGSFTVQLPSGTYGVVTTTASQTFVAGSDIQGSASGVTVSIPSAGVMTIYQR